MTKEAPSDPSDPAGSPGSSSPVASSGEPGSGEPSASDTGDVDAPVEELVEDPPTPVPDEPIAPRVPRIAPWRSGYRLNDLLGDGVAGTLVAVLLVPQALAYAQLAGLPSDVGIAAAVVAPVVYALFARSRFLALGPVALVSLLVGDALGPEDAVGTALLLAAMIGLVLVVLGGLRLGFLFRVFTPPVLAGFVAGAAILIVTSQVGTMLDVPVERGVPPVTAWGQAIAELPDANWISALVGGLVLVGLLVLPSVLRRLLRVEESDGVWRGHVVRALPLVLVFLAAVAMELLHLEDRGVATLGVVELPSMLPSLPNPAGMPWAQLAGSAVVISLVAAVTTLAIAQDLARREGEDVSTNRELFSLGASSMFVSVFGGYPIGGSLSRSAVAADSGGRSPLAAVVGAALLVVATLLAGDLLGAIPRTALAGLIMAAAISVLNPREARGVWGQDRRIAVAMAVPFVVVVVLGPVAGLVAAVAAGGVHLWLERGGGAASSGDAD